MKQTIELLILIFVISNTYSLNNNVKHYNATKLQNYINVEHNTENDSLKLLNKPQFHSRYSENVFVGRKSTSLNYQKYSSKHRNSLQKHVKKEQSNNRDKNSNNGNAHKQKKIKHYANKKQNQISHVKRQRVNNKDTITAHDKKPNKHQSINEIITQNKQRPEVKEKFVKDIKKSQPDKKTSVSNYLSNKSNYHDVRRDNKSIQSKAIRKSSKNDVKEHQHNKNSKLEIRTKKSTKLNNQDLKQINKQYVSQHGRDNYSNTSKPNVRRQVKQLKNLSKTSRNYRKQLSARTSQNNYKKKLAELNNQYKNNMNPNKTQTKKPDTIKTEPVINQIKTLNTKQPRHQNSSKVMIEHEFPYMAAVINGQEFLCAGALIDEQWVLTVADKLYSVQGSIYFLRVRLGSINRKKGGQLLSVKYLKIHPYYDSSKPTYDLALIKLSNPVMYSGNLRSVRLQLVPKEITVTHFIVTSWAEKFAKSKRLSVIEPILSVSHLHPSDPEECVEELNQISASSDGVMCLDTAVDDACRRDVGAPVVTNGLLWGLISSWKPPSCDEEDIMTYVTTMSAKNITNWVHASIHGHTMDPVK